MKRNSMRTPVKSVGSPGRGWFVSRRLQTEAGDELRQVDVNLLLPRQPAEEPPHGMGLIDADTFSS